MTDETPAKKVAPPLLRTYLTDGGGRQELGLDEAGRGPLFGRLYVGGVVLPQGTDDFQFSMMRDSKKFTSRAKRQQVAQYIKEHAIAWHVAFVEPEEIDRINISQAVFKGMHECVEHVVNQLEAKGFAPWSKDNGLFLVVDGNRFEPYARPNVETGRFNIMDHVTVEGGDNRFCHVAAASILAKVAHDEYIADMCRQYPALEERYHLSKSMGYGTAAHLSGIREHGISQWHRKTFGESCRNARLNIV